MKKLAFITKSEVFDSLITAFRKTGDEALKKDISDNLKSFDVLIIDLGIPLEMAYPLLEKIKSDYYFSDKIIIASISHRSQLVKLRSFALGCDGYISPNIEHKELLLKIQELQDPSRFLIKKVFSNETSLISFDASLTHISENGCLIKSKVSIDSEHKKLELTSKLIDDLNLNHKIQYFISKSNPIAKRSFVTEVHFSNLNDEDRQKIRKMVHGWSAL